MTNNLRMAGIAVLLALLGQQNLVSSVQIGEEGTPFPGSHHRAAISGRMQRGIDDDIPPASSSPQLGWKERMMGGMSAMGKRAKAFGEGAKSRLGMKPKPTPLTDDVEDQQPSWRERAMGGMSAMSKRAKTFGEGIAANKHVVNGMDALRRGRDSIAANKHVRYGMDAMRNGQDRIARAFNPFGKPVKPDVEDLLPKKQSTKSANEPNATNGTNAAKGSGSGSGSGSIAKADTKGEPADPAESLVEDHKPKSVKKKVTKSAEEPTALATNGTNATEEINETLFPTDQEIPEDLLDDKGKGKGKGMGDIEEEPFEGLPEPPADEEAEGDEVISGEEGKGKGKGKGKGMGGIEE